MIAWALLAAAATAQSYRMPAGDADYSSFYPTAYYDHGGSTDWNCGGISYSGHNGTDLGVGSWAGMDAGMDIVAAADGVVGSTHDGEFDACTTADCSGGGGYGNHVRIDHADGRETIYAHMKKWSVEVAAGQVVGCGTKLGQVGSSGYSTGPHLHFELRTAGNDRVDPFVGSCNGGTSSWVSQGSYDGLPAPTCDAPIDECQPTQTLTCGDSISGRNDGAGATTDHWFYGCSEFTYSGAETAYAVLTDRSEPVTVSLTGLSADLDLYLLSTAACDGSGCAASSTEPDASSESATANATAGVALTVVIDGWESAVSDYTLTVDCDGQLPRDDPPPDSDPPTDTAVATDTAPPTDSDATGTGPRSPDPDAEGWDRVDRPEGRGLGCAAAPVPLLASWWLPGLLAVRRRRTG